MGCGASKGSHATASNRRILELEQRILELEQGGVRLQSADTGGKECSPHGCTAVGESSGVEAAAEESITRKHTCELGVTLGYLVEFLKELDQGFFRDSPDFTTDDLVEKFIKPAVKQQQCRYVDLMDQRFVKPPSVFVSHRWKGGFRFLVERLQKQFDFATDASAREKSVWLDVFAVNQNQNEETKRDVDGFERVIQQTSITAFNLDEKGEALRRVWCLYEVWKTFSHRGVDSLLVMSQGIDALELREIFYTIDVAKAEAFMASDVERILADIRKEFAFPDFNRRVRDALLESTTRQVRRIDTAGAAEEGGNGLMSSWTACISIVLC